MQRYSAPNCGGGFNSSAVGGPSARDSVRADSAYSSSNYSLNSRRQPQVTPYKLKCEKEPLNCRLGPPDFYPQTPSCPEETLTREYLLSGYKETVEGIEESKEIILTKIGYLSKPAILKCNEAIRKRLRAINESRAQKRKAGQVYGVPLSGQLLVKPGLFPEQRQFGEDLRKKWIEGLSQQHKRLRSLADHVPHGYRKKGLLEIVIRHNVPLLRATWFIKVTYLNQVRPTAGVSSGTLDKTQLARTELWTKDLIEYLQHLLEEFLAKDGFCPPGPRREHTSQALLFGVSKQRNDLLSSIPNSEEPSLLFRWEYILRLLQWHYVEGLLSPSLILEWVLAQLQERDSVDATEFILPIVVDMIESIAMSQTYVRLFVDMAIRLLHNLHQGSIELISGGGKSYLASALVDLLRYLLLSVPDSFVALDCFPLPISVAPDTMNARGIFPVIPELADKVDHNSQDAYNCYLSFGHIASTLLKRATNLAKTANVDLQGHGVAKVVQALDKALIDGEVRVAYNGLFEELSDSAVEESWIAEINPCLKSSLKWIGTVNSSVIYAVFFLCEWATCDFRDFRNLMPQDAKFTGRKDFCQVYVAVLLLKYWMENMHNSFQSTKNSSLELGNIAKNASVNNGFSGEATLENISEHRSSKTLNGRSTSDILQSPGPLHDIIVCWLDQHCCGKGDRFKRFQVLIMELIRNGIFYPQAYVRQLIVSGVMDRTGTAFNLDRQRRHHRVLKQLPGSCLSDALEESGIADAVLICRAVQVYANERNLVLRGFCSWRSVHTKKGRGSSASFDSEKLKDQFATFKDGSPPFLLDNRKNSRLGCSRTTSRQVKSKSLAQLKVAISALLHFPDSCCSSIDTELSESQASLKRSFGSLGTKVDFADGRPDCEECARAKRQRSNNERHIQGFSSNQSDDEDTWWVRRGTKSLESFKAEQPLKSAKHASRGRQKTVRKTQSLAQLAAARIEGSQGASTSHVCDNKLSCPHHKTGVDGEVPKLVDGMTTMHLNDIGRTLKTLRWLEKRSIVIWLLKSIRLLIEGNENASSKLSQCSGPFSLSTEERGAVRWKLGEDELSSIIYLLDISSDLYSLVKFLLWLLPKILKGTSDVHLGRNAAVLSRNKENHIFNIGEAYLFSALQRYENVLVATDLLPEALGAAMHQAVTLVASNGRPSSSFAFVYARNLLKKYGSTVSVAKWERSFKATCDPRLLAEIDTRRSVDGDIGYPLGGPAGVDDPDDYFRQKISGRIPRAGQIMKEIVQRKVEEAVVHFYGKERKLFSAAANTKIPTLENWDDAYQIAQQIVLLLLDCVRQNGGTSQEADPSLVAVAVSAIVFNVGPAIAKLPDFTSSSNYQSFSSAASPLSCARGILNIHVACLCLLKEAFGERHSRVMDIALSIEAASNITGAYALGRVPRGQFQLSPETHDLNPNISNDISNNKMFSGRASKIAASVSALIVGVIVRGVSSLQRMITVFKLKEGLDILLFMRSVRSSSNGISRSTGNYKSDHYIEVNVHWFRLLVGNCRTLFDGLVSDILGESSTLALSRMQRMLPLNLVFPPAYSIFAMVIWRPYIINNNIATREDFQLYQYLSVAISDAINHQPFRDLCLRDTCGLYDLISSDASECEFAAMLEAHSPDKHMKTMAFVPLRGRLFLNAIVDCSMPSFTATKDDGSWVSGHSEPRHIKNETKVLDKLVHILDTLQPAKFHWQWVELRLLLNEQALIEKIEMHSMSVVEALQSLSTTAENDALSENESAFTDIVLTRLLVRPDAASLYSEVFHLLGRSLEEKLLLQTKWFLAGNDVLLGRKSIRQRLVNVAQDRGLSTKSQFWKLWGWSTSISDMSVNRIEKRKLDVNSLEEGEVVEEGVDNKRLGKLTNHMFNGVGFNANQHYLTDKALAELVLPCIGRSSNEARATFATDLIKQMSTIYQHITLLTRGGNKQSAGGLPSGGDVSSNKGSTRKGIRGGSPGIGRRTTGTKDPTPPSAAALKASIWLRLQFLLRLLPIVFPDREPSSRNLRHTLASVVLHLLGTQLVYEDAEVSLLPVQRAPRKELELLTEASIGNSLDVSGGSLFDVMLSVLHGLLSRCKPSWLKTRLTSKLNTKSSRDPSVIDRDLVESLQADLDGMQLPASIRRRLQAAMPILPPNPPLVVSCHPPLVPSAARSLLHPVMLTGALQQANPNSPQRTVSSARPASNISVRSKPLPVPETDMEVDPWTLLEDGAGSASASSNGISSGGVSSDHSNLKASCWLKGAVRVRRTDLTYVGATDDGS